MSKTSLAAPTNLPFMMPEQFDKKEFGRRLTALLEARGMSQTQLARRVDIGKDSISTYARGLTVPHMRNILKIAKALNVVPAELVPGLSYDPGMTPPAGSGGSVLPGVSFQIQSGTPYISMQQVEGSDMVRLNISYEVDAKTAATVIALLVPRDTAPSE